MEDEKIALEEIQGIGLTRRDFVKRTAAAGAGLGLLGTLAAEPAFGRADALDVVRWISPRGTLDVMDDYNVRVPIAMGYFKQLGIKAQLNAGSGSGEMQLVAAHKVDMGYPSPGVLSSAIDAGVPVIGIWEQYPAQVFDFVLPGDSKITSPSQLAGKKTLSLVRFSAAIPVTRNTSSLSWCGPLPWVRLPVAAITPSPSETMPPGAQMPSPMPPDDQAATLVGAFTSMAPIRPW